MAIRHPQYGIDDVVYHVKGKAYGVVRSYDLLTQEYTIKLVSDKNNPNSGFGMVFLKAEELVPATELADAIYG